MTLADLGGFPGCGRSRSFPGPWYLLRTEGNLAQKCAKADHLAFSTIALDYFEPEEDWDKMFLSSKSALSTTFLSILPNSKYLEYLGDCCLE